MKHFFVTLGRAAYDAAADQLIEEGHAFVDEAGIFKRMTDNLLNTEALRLIGATEQNDVYFLGNGQHLAFYQVKLKRGKVKILLDHLGIGGTDEGKLITDYLRESFKDVDSTVTVVPDDKRILINQRKATSYTMNALGYANRRD